MPLDINLWVPISCEYCSLDGSTSAYLTTGLQTLLLVLSVLQHLSVVCWNINLGCKTFSSLITYFKCTTSFPNNSTNDIDVRDQCAPLGWVTVCLVGRPHAGLQWHGINALMTIMISSVYWWWCVYSIYNIFSSLTFRTGFSSCKNIGLDVGSSIEALVTSSRILNFNWWNQEVTCVSLTYCC